MFSLICVCSEVWKYLTFPINVFQANCATIEEVEQTPDGSTKVPMKCPYPSYYSYIGVLALIVISMPVYISYLGKSMLMFMLAGAQCGLNIILGPNLDREDSKPPGSMAVSLKYSLSATLLTIALALVVVTRYVSC